MASWFADKSGCGAVLKAILNSCRRDWRMQTFRCLKKYFLWVSTSKASSSVYFLSTLIPEVFLSSSEASPSCKHGRGGSSKTRQSAPLVRVRCSCGNLDFSAGFFEGSLRNSFVVSVWAAAHSFRSWKRSLPADLTRIHSFETSGVVWSFNFRREKIDLSKFRSISWGRIWLLTPNKLENMRKFALS